MRFHSIPLFNIFFVMMMLMHTRISRSKTDKSKFFAIYISIILLIVANNCVLTYFALHDTSMPVKIFTCTALMPSIVYFIETITTRDCFVEIFREIKDIKRALVPRRRKDVATLPICDVIKIISALMVFIIQMAIVFVSCLTEEVINYDT